MSSTCTYPIYREAATLLRTGGWCQKAWHNRRRRCGGQAIIDAAAKYGLKLDEKLNPQIVGELHNHLMSYASYRQLWASQGLKDRAPAAEDLVMWNDGEGRTKDEVVTMLDSLADKLELQALRRENRQLHQANRKLRRQLSAAERLSCKLRLLVVELRAELAGDVPIKQYETELGEASTEPALVTAAAN